MLGERLDSLPGRADVRRLQLVIQLLLCGQPVQQLLVPRLDEPVEVAFVSRNVALGNRIEETVRAGEQDEHLALHHQRLVLPLLEHLDEPPAAIELILRRLVEVAAELRKGGQLAELRQVEPQGARHLPHGPHLGRAAHPGHGVADVDGRTNALVEQIRLQEDLPVGNRDDVGRDVGRQVAGLGFDDRQRRQRAAAQLRAQLRRPLQEPRVQVEHVAGVRLATRRAAQQQRDLPVRLRVLGEIVVDAERVPPAVAEVLAHCARAIGADVQQRRRLGGARRNDDGVLHGARFFQRAHDLRNGRLLLAHRVVDADDVEALLVDDRVDRHRRLARLAVADDQLALAAADRDHRVDCLEAGLQRLLDRLAVHDARRDLLDRGVLRRGDGTLAVDRLAQGVDDAAQQRFADRHRDDATRALDGVAFLDLGRLAQQHGADALLLEVERDAEYAVRELEHLGRHRTLDTVYPGDAVADRHDGANFGDIDVELVAAELVLDDPRYFVCLDVHPSTPTRPPTTAAAAAPGAARCCRPTPCCRSGRSRRR